MSGDRSGLNLHWQAEPDWSAVELRFSVLLRPVRLVTSCARNQTRQARASCWRAHFERDLARLKTQMVTMFDGTSIAGQTEKSRRLGAPRVRQVGNSQRGSSRAGSIGDKSSVGDDMTKRAVPSTVGDIVQQRRIDLAAAYRLLCRLSLKDSIDSHTLSAFPALKTFSCSQYVGALTACNRVTVQYQLRQFRRSLPTSYQSGRLRHARAIQINEARRGSAQDTEDSL